MTRPKIIGLLGGMGPLATAYYFEKLISNQSYDFDQDYPRIIVDNHTHIPDRTQAILHGGEDPIPKLLESVQLLNQAQVTHAFMTCFTAHHFIKPIKEHAEFEFISVFDVLNDYLQSKQHIKKIGIIATTGSQQVGLFEQYLTNVTLCYPDVDHQSMVMNAIYSTQHGIKANRITQTTLSWIDQAAKSLINQDVDLLIAGCTEIGLIISKLKHQDKWLDPMMLIIDKLTNK